MIIYLDKNDRCHTVNDGILTAYETDYFNGKCPAYIEGYCCEITENSVAYYPWRDSALLDEFQKQYEAQQQIINEYEAALSEIETALGVTSE